MARFKRGAGSASTTRHVSPLSGLIESFHLTVSPQGQQLVVKLLSCLASSPSPLRLTELVERIGADADTVSVRMGQLMKDGAVQEVDSVAYCCSGTGKKFLEFLKGVIPTEQAEAPERDLPWLREAAASEPADAPNGRAIIITPDACPVFDPEARASLKPADVLCLDLDEFGLEKALGCIRGARQFEIQNPGEIVPGIVLIGSTSGMGLAEAYSLSQRVSAAGAIFYERPHNMSFKETVAHLNEVRNKIYAAFHRHENGFYPKGSAVPAETRRQGPGMVAGDSAGPDSQANDDPLLRLSDEDYQDLIKRMDAPDESWET